MVKDLEPVAIKVCQNSKSGWSRSRHRGRKGFGLTGKRGRVRSLGGTFAMKGQKVKSTWQKRGARVGARMISDCAKTRKCGDMRGPLLGGPTQRGD